MSELPGAMQGKAVHSREVLGAPFPIDTWSDAEVLLANNQVLEYYDMLFQ